MAFVQLNRRFLPYNKADHSGDSYEDSYDNFEYRREKGFGWEELLSNRLTVVLGDQGAGKTTEFKEQAVILSKEGSYAFFLRLRSLIQGELSSAIELGSDYERWLDSRKEGFFFLDSIDEARLQLVPDFQTAIRRFRHQLGDNHTRARIIISSRVFDWQPEADALELATLFPAPHQRRFVEGDKILQAEPSSESNPLVVRLAPLDRSRVEKFVKVTHPETSPDFLKALDEGHCWHLVGRPGDVSNLIRFWETHKRLGPYRMVLESTINKRLESSSREGRDPLSHARGLEGAMALAAASVFCQEVNFGLHEDGSKSHYGIDPQKCLPKDWMPNEIKAFLSRSLFESGGYGMLRIHHRESSEFLAAHWIKAQMESRLSNYELRETLFRVVEGRPLLRASTAPLTAWLCGDQSPWSSLVRAWVLETHPEVVLRYGDAETLPPTFRKEVLRRIVERSKAKTDMWLNGSRANLRRFAHEVLIEDINGFIGDETLPVGLRGGLIHIAQLGRMAGTSSVLLEVVRNPGRHEKLRLYSVMALGEIGVIEPLIELAEIVSRIEAIEPTLAGFLCEVLYPRVLGEAELVELLSRVDGDDGSDCVYRIASHFSVSLSGLTASSSMLRGLLSLILRDSKEGGELNLRIDARNSWMANLLPSVVAVVLRELVIPKSVVEDVTDAILIMSEQSRKSGLHASESSVALCKLLEEHPEIRQAYFRKRVQYERDRGRRGIFPLAWVFRQSEMLERPDDVEWLVRELGTGELEYRKIVLDTVLRVMWASGHGRRYGALLRTSLLGQEELILERSRLTWARRCNRLKEYWGVIVGDLYSGRDPWWQWPMHRAQNKWSGLRTRVSLLLKYRSIERGEATGTLKWLISTSLGGKDHLTLVSFEEIERRHGRMISSATRSGSKAFWRGYEPKLPFRIENGLIDGRVYVGLTGLAAEFEDRGHDFREFSNEEARLATHYAVNELNEFPKWLTALAKSHEFEVKSILLECIDGELSLCREHGILSRLAWGKGELMNLVGPNIFDRLGQATPESYRLLQSALVIASNADTVEREALADLCSDRGREGESEELGLRAQWLTLWVQLDAPKCLAHLESCLSALPDADKLMERVCSLLSGEAGFVGLVLEEQSFMMPEMLKRFLLLVYRHVTPSSDIHRIGSYSPTARDNAQVFRNSLLQRAINYNGKDMTEVLVELAEMPEMSMSRDWILERVEDRRASEGDHAPWRPEDIREYWVHSGVEPRSGAELFEIVVKRLRDIKLSVEEEDYGERKAVHKSYDETELRRWAARELRKVSGGRYTCPEEVERDWKQRPDIQIENASVNAPVSIEAKKAEKWSFTDLRAALMGQLVEKYLRQHDYGFGILLLGYIDDADRKSWEPKKGLRLSFEETVKELQIIADGIVEERSDIEGLWVVGIDFRGKR